MRRRLVKITRAQRRQARDDVRRYLLTGESAGRDIGFAERVAVHHATEHLTHPGKWPPAGDGRQNSRRNLRSDPPASTCRA